jgi:hypothetical protein
MPVPGEGQVLVETLACAFERARSSSGPVRIVYRA